MNRFQVKLCRTSRVRVEEDVPDWLNVAVLYNTPLQEFSTPPRPVNFLYDMGAYSRHAISKFFRETTGVICEYVMNNIMKHPNLSFQCTVILTNCYRLIPFNQ